MPADHAASSFRALPRAEQEQLFLDIIKTPAFTHKGSFGEWFHCWLEDQSAESRPLGEIAKRLDFPNYRDADIEDPWAFFIRHISWLIEEGYARVVRIVVVA